MPALYLVALILVLPTIAFGQQEAPTDLEYKIDIFASDHCDRTNPRVFIYARQLCIDSATVTLNLYLNEGLGRHESQRRGIEQCENLKHKDYEEFQKEYNTNKVSPDMRRYIRIINNDTFMSCMYGAGAPTEFYLNYE